MQIDMIRYVSAQLIPPRSIKPMKEITSKQHAVVVDEDVASVADVEDVADD